MKRVILLHLFGVFPHICNVEQVDATRPFFIKVELPKTAVKGEQLGVQIAVFNYWTQPIEVRFLCE